MVYNLIITHQSREATMSLEFFTPTHDNFDNTNAFRKYYKEVFYQSCLTRTIDLVGRDGNLDSALRIELQTSLKELQMDAVSANALYMMNGMDLYQDLRDLSELSQDVDSEFNDLCVESEQNSFEDVYSTLRKLCPDNLLQVQQELFNIALEGASVKHIEALRQDLALEPTQVASYASELGFPTYGALVYSVANNLDAEVDFIVDEFGWKDGNNLETLATYVALALEDDSLTSFNLLRQIEIVRQFVEVNLEQVLDGAIARNAIKVFDALLEEHKGFLREDDAMGFEVAHVLAQSAAEYKKPNMLEKIVTHPDYKGVEGEGKPHLLVLVDIALEKQDAASLEVLMPHAAKYLNQLNAEQEPYWLDLMKEVTESNDSDSLQLLLANKTIGEGVKLFAASERQTIDEYARDVYSTLFARAIYFDSDASLDVLVKHTLQGTLRSPESKLLIIKMASDLDAKKCMQALNDEFYDEALVALFEELERAEFDDESEEVFYYGRKLENTKKIFDDVIKTKGPGTINEPINDEGQTVLELALFMGLTDLAAHIMRGYLVDEVFQQEAFDMVNGEGHNIVHQAVLNGDVGFLTELLQLEGAEEAVQVKDNHHHTPLTLALSEFGAEASGLVEILVEEACADINALGADDKAPLQWAEEETVGEASLLVAVVKRLQKQAGEVLSQNEAEESELEENLIQCDEEALDDYSVRGSSFSSVDGSAFSDSAITSDGSAGKLREKAKVYIHKKGDVDERRLSTGSEDSVDEVAYEVYRDFDGGLVYERQGYVPHSESYKLALASIEVGREEGDKQAAPKVLVREESDSDFFEGYNFEKPLRKLSVSELSDDEHVNEVGICFTQVPIRSSKGLYVIKQMQTRSSDALNLFSGVMNPWELHDNLPLPASLFNSQLLGGSYESDGHISPAISAY